MLGIVIHPIDLNAKGRILNPSCDCIQSKSEGGFTLIELIVVIVLLAIVAITASPKFLDMSNDARASVVKGTGTALDDAIRLVHQKVLIQGGGPIDNLQVYGDQEAGQLDINQWGYPAQHWTPFESSPRLGNNDDCISVWQTVLLDGPSVSTSNDAETSAYRASYQGGDTCRYFLNELPELSIFYDSRNGIVSVDSDYSS